MLNRFLQQRSAYFSVYESGKKLEMFQLRQTRAYRPLPCRPTCNCADTFKLTPGREQLWIFLLNEGGEMCVKSVSLSFSLAAKIGL